MSTPKKWVPKIHLDDPRPSEPETREVAQREPINYRYDILDPMFLAFMAMIADYGARKYGESNWKKSRLTKDKSPINHIYKHLRSFQECEPYDHPEVGTDKSIHLAAIAFNAMMEFYHSVRENTEE